MRIEGSAALMRAMAPAIAVIFSLCLPGCSRDPADDPEFLANCAGKPLASIEERQAAVEAGYIINQRFDCIDRASFEAVALENALSAQRKAAKAAKPSSISKLATSLAAARTGFRTRLGAPPANPMPFPAPPADLFVRSDFKSGSIGKLAAWITPDPHDGAKHPAIVWLTGGDSSSLDDFWTEGSPANDQSASAYRKAGIIMMFPTLRGGNTNPGSREYFLGEVDDVLAAADHLARLPYVDPRRLYLGGHSTGGTLALLAAETSDRFAAVFAFGAVADVTQYPTSIMPLNIAQASSDERQLRSPVHWIGGIDSPVYLIEGADAPSNVRDLDVLCESRNPEVRCISVPGTNHFSVLDAVSRKLAARIVADLPRGEPLLRQQEFPR